jgi:hypothetical protein
MSSIKRAIKVAKLLHSRLVVDEDVNGSYVVDVAYAWKKEAGMLRPITGRGFSIEEACTNFLSKCSGTLVRIDGRNKDVEINVVTL